MAQYKLGTIEKKNVVEREIWVHKTKGWHAIYEQLWRWGEVIITTDEDEEIDIDLNNEDGIDVNDLGYNVDIDSLDDGCSTDWEFSDNMSEEDRETVVNGWDEDSHMYMEDNGWELENVELWFTGPLKLKKLD